MKKPSVRLLELQTTEVNRLRRELGDIARMFRELRGTNRPGAHVMAQRSFAVSKPMKDLVAKREKVRARLRELGFDLESLINR